MEKEKRIKKSLPDSEYDYRVKLYADGKYHWKYDLNMLKNPAVLIDVYWVLGVTMAIFACIIFLIQACSGGFHLEDMGFALKIIGITGAIMFVLGLLGYLLYAAVSGWTYTVLFTMDENGVEHRQGARSEKVAKRIAVLTVLAGIASKKPSVAGSGMLAASRTSMRSDFSAVKKVKAVRWMNTIKVKESFEKNRVYADDADFDFVYEFIRSRCPNAKVS